MIRNAKEKDITKIMEMIELSKEKMYKEGNFQWQDGYPSKDLFLKDISKSALYVLEEENKIKGCISIEKNATDSYQNVIKETSSKDSYVFHRLCIHPEFRHQQVATKLLKYGEELSKKDNTYVIKADTEIHNKAMIQLFEKLKYQKIAEFEWDDYPGHFIYFEKYLGSEQHEL